MPAGRPTKYKKEYCQQILEFFNIDRTKTILERFYYKNGDEKEKEVEVANELPTIQGFCSKIGINKTTLHKWVKANKEFDNAYKEAKDLQENFWLQNSIRGLYPAAFAIFTGKNMFGWRDDRYLTGDDKQPIFLQVIQKSPNEKTDVSPTINTKSETSEERQGNSI